MTDILISTVYVIGHHFRASVGLQKLMSGPVRASK